MYGIVGQESVESSGSDSNDSAEWGYSAGRRSFLGNVSRSGIISHRLPVRRHATYKHGGLA